MANTVKIVKNRIGIFSQLKKVWKHKKINLRTKIRILGTAVMRLVNYGFEAWALWKADEDLLDVFHGNYLRIVLGTRRTDRISNSRLCEKCGSIPLSRAIMRERLRWLGHVLPMKDDRLPKIVIFGQPSSPFQPAVKGQTKRRSSPNGVGGYRKERFMGNESFLRGSHWIDWIRGGVSVALLASGVLVL